jgi:hypothetical protein
VLLILSIPDLIFKKKSGSPTQDDATEEEIKATLRAYYGVEFMPHPSKEGKLIPIPEHAMYTERGLPSMPKCAAVHARSNDTAPYRAKKRTCLSPVNLECGISTN